MKNLLTLLTLASAMTLLVGCAATHQMGDVEKSGFLKDYSMLKEGEDGEALLVYRNPDADFSKYDKILLEPIEIWRPKDSDLADLSEEDVQYLGNHLYESLKTELEKDYTLVASAGPGVLRIRGAITEASGSIAPLNMISTVIPVTRVISAGKRLITGTGAFVGKASVEGEFTDSESGELLFAAVDRRAGAKTVMGSLSTWDDVREAYDYWAERVRARLAEERTRK
jgi:hypothetical protein